MPAVRAFELDASTTGKGLFNQNFCSLSSIQARRRGGQEGAGAPPAFQLGEQGELPFLNAMICFPIVHMIQRRSYKLKASHI